MQLIKLFPVTKHFKVYGYISLFSPFLQREREVMTSGSISWTMKHSLNGVCY